jgi:hypothetical protein
MLGRQHPSVDDNKLGFSSRRPGNGFGKAEHEPPKTQQSRSLEEASAPHHRGIQISFSHDSKLHDIEITLEISTTHQGHIFWQPPSTPQWRRCATALETSREIDQIKAI